MDKLMSLALHPLITLNIWSYDDGIDIFYLLSLFFAFGIWLVFQRYQRAHNSAVPFKFTIPEVRQQYFLVSVVIKRTKMFSLPKLDGGLL